MEFWNENKKLVLTVAAVVLTALLVIKFFDVILVGVVLAAIGVAAVVAWRHYGGAEGIWKALAGE